MRRLVMLHKPYGVLSQFTDEGRWRGLAWLRLGLPSDMYPVGRLDADSEGLLLLTNDNRLKTRLLDPNERHVRTYHVQVEGDPNEMQLAQLSRPMALNLKGRAFQTGGCSVRRIHPTWPARVPPVRERKTVPDTWLELSLTEGKNRQVRRMTAAIQCPTLRLIRVHMGPWALGDLAPGELRELDLGTFPA